MIAYLWRHNGALPTEIDLAVPHGHKRLASMRRLGLVYAGEKRADIHSGRYGYTHWLTPASIIVHNIGESPDMACSQYIPNAKKDAVPEWVRCVREDEHDRPFDCHNENGRAPARPTVKVVKLSTPACAHPEERQVTAHVDGILVFTCLDCNEVLPMAWDDTADDELEVPDDTQLRAALGGGDVAPGGHVRDEEPGSLPAAPELPVPEPGVEEAETTDSARDDYRTPEQLFDNICRHFYFTLDAAATEESATVSYLDNVDGVDVTVMPFLSGPHGKVRCSETPCGLCADWGDNGVWCNPPYSRLASWVSKCVDASRNGATVVLLGLPYNGDSWMRTVHATASEVWFLLPRVEFVPAPGLKVSRNMRGSMLTVWRPGPLPLGGPRYRMYDWKRDEFIGEEVADDGWSPDNIIGEEGQTIVEEEWSGRLLQVARDTRDNIKALIREVMAEERGESVPAAVEAPDLVLDWAGEESPSEEYPELEIPELEL